MSKLFNNWDDFFEYEKQNHTTNFLNIFNEKLKKNKIYDDYFYYEYNDKNNGIEIIIPVKNRVRFLKYNLDFLKKETEGKKISIMVVEQNEIEEHKELVLSYGFNYVFIKLKDNFKFNKSKCLNYGTIVSRAKKIIYYDVDLIFGDEYIDKLLLNINDDTNFIQCFSNREVYDLGELYTEKLLKNEISNNELEDNKDKFNTQVHGIRVPWGVILMDKNLFLNVGGFDDYMFEGWGGEDDLMIEKIKLFTQFNVCDKPTITAFHMSHPRELTNQEHEHIVGLFRLSYDEIKFKIIEDIKSRLDLITRKILE